MKNIVRSVLFVGLFVFCLSSAYSSNADVCDFEGFVAKPLQWEEIEFSNLLKSEEMPGYRLMVAIIGKFAVTDSDILKSPSCKVSKYVSELVRFYKNNETTIKKKHSDIAELLDYISNNV